MRNLARWLRRLLGGAPVGDGVLLVRQRHAGDIGAADLGKIQAQPAPAAADVEHAAVALEQELGGKMPSLGKLRFVERLIEALEIATAILPVGVEEQRIEPPVEIVMVRHIVAGAPARVELAEAPLQVAQQILRPRPVRNLGLLAETNGEHVGDRAFLDHEGAVHIGFAELEFGIEQDAPFGGARGKTYRYRLAGPIAEGQNRAARGGNAKCPPPDKGLEQKSKQPVHRPPPSLKQSTPRRRRSPRTVNACRQANAPATLVTLT